jgi:deazaflavin-dependent oxidoreductase (nitroreductase family)
MASASPLQGVIGERAVAYRIQGLLEQRAELAQLRAGQGAERLMCEHPRQARVTRKPPIYGMVAHATGARRSARGSPMTDYADWQKNLIADIRANGRPTSGYFEGRPVMVLTTTGAKSGEPRTVVVSFSRDGDDYVVVGSKSGEPEDPAWFTNLVANPVVTVETDGQTFQARATVAEGADRDTLWDRHVAEHPQFAEYPSKTDRIIPIARLKPLG